MLISNSEQNLIEGILKNGISALDNALVDSISPNLEKYLQRCLDEHLDYPTPILNLPEGRNWFVPKKYQEMDIEQFLIDLAKTDEEISRVREELDLYKKHNMIDVLKSMKYIVDTLRENNIVWGVGRGSSVSSYCLYLIGIHKINSIKYDLPISEFFKGEENG
jgi:DNA polymerase III alpha subunit